MSTHIQQTILRTVGICLVTMLILVVAQAAMQSSHLFDLTNTPVLMVILFPLFALLSGIAARMMTGSLWSAVIISGVAFSAVVLVLINFSSMIYVPVYMLISLGGYLLIQWVRRNKLPNG